jgi:cytochrome P450/NADPH-cytochrome P450 reductase
MPVFSPLSTKGMFDDMFEVISQLVLKWERFGPEHEIDPTDDFTRLAFETMSVHLGHQAYPGYRVSFNPTVAQQRAMHVQL